MCHVKVQVIEGNRQMREKFNTGGHDQVDESANIGADVNKGNSAEWSANETQKERGKVKTSMQEC